MKAINVEIKGVRVASFSPSKKDVSIVIFFNDGKEKEITKTMAVMRGEDAAHLILKDIRNVETRLNAEFDGKGVFDSYTNIIINNEEKIQGKIGFFLSKVFEKINVITNQKSADGYVHLVNQVNNMRLEF